MVEIKNGVVGVSGITDVSGDVTLIKSYTDTEVASILSYVDTEVADIKTQTDKLKYLLGTATSDVTDPVNMVTEVVANSIISNILTDDGNTVNYDRTTMSLEANTIRNLLIKVETDKIPAEVIKTTALGTALGTLSDEETTDTICGRTYVLKRHFHGRNRSYPFLGPGITLTGHNTANTLAATHTEIVPVLANEVNTMTITHAADAAGNVVINLNGTVFIKAVSIGTINEVAAQLREYVYVGAEGGAWTVTSNPAALEEVIFTRAGLSTTATFLDVGTTGVTATIAKTATGAGINKPFDIHVIQGGIANNKDTYTIELCSGLAGYEQRIGNIRVSTEAVNSAAGMIPIMTAIMPAGTRITARVASGTGGSDTIVVSLNYHLY